MPSGRAHEHGQAAVEILALLPLLAGLGALVLAIAASSHSWVRAESAARAGARAAAVGAPLEEAARRTAPPGARVALAEGRRARGDGRGTLAPGVSVVVPAGAAGPRALALPALEGWSELR